MEDLSVSTCTNSENWPATRLMTSAQKPRRWPRFLKGLRAELKTILASQDFLIFSHLSNKAIQVERAREEEKGHLKRKFQVLRAQQQDWHQKTRSFGFPPKGPSFIRPVGPTPSRFSQQSQSSFQAPRLQATNRQQMPVGTAETPVTSRTTAPS
jgi:hypothetical protein